MVLGVKGCLQGCKELTYSEVNIPPKPRAEGSNPSTPASRFRGKKGSGISYQEP